MTLDNFAKVHSPFVLRTRPIRSPSRYFQKKVCNIFERRRRRLWHLSWHQHHCFCYKLSTGWLHFLTFLTFAEPIRWAKVRSKYLLKFQFPKKVCNIFDRWRQRRRLWHLNWQHHHCFCYKLSTGRLHFLT